MSPEKQITRIKLQNSGLSLLYIFFWNLFLFILLKYNIICSCRQREKSQALSTRNRFGGTQFDPTPPILQLFFFSLNVDSDRDFCFVTRFRLHFQPLIGLSVKKRIRVLDGICCFVRPAIRWADLMKTWPDDCEQKFFINVKQSFDCRKFRGLIT